MSFSRRLMPGTFFYNAEGRILERCQSCKDLGVIFDQRLSFRTSIESIIATATKMLGFIIRTMRYFSGSDSLRCFYFALVRFRLEYCAIVWFPGVVKFCAPLKRVQHRYFKYLHFGSSVSILIGVNLMWPCWNVCLHIAQCFNHTLYLNHAHTNLLTDSPVRRS